jgi:oxygen-independent coproporphyrinogen-3 oxidase
MHLYIHIPFCRSRCAYCDYLSFAHQEQLIEAYVEAVCKELAMLASQKPIYTSPELRPSIFIGGGTPSLLSPEQIAAILHAADSLIPLASAEVTMEINPGTLMGTDQQTTYNALDYLRLLREVGVNRLSMGVQSLTDSALQMLGRIHTAGEARSCFADARRAGFEQINVDMIFGIPGQTLSRWRHELHTLLAWQPEHISLYALIVDVHTPLGQAVQSGKRTLPDEDTTAAMYEAAIADLSTAGYMHYEISNWARQPAQGYLCHHNMAYWYNDDYLAVGAGAQGHVYPERYGNVQQIAQYIASVQAGQRPIGDTIILSIEDLYAETMFMGLRLHEGVRFAHFRERCGADIQTVYGDTLVSLEELGLLEHDCSAVRLTSYGRLLGNRVFEQFA